MGRVKIKTWNVSLIMSLLIFIIFIMLVRLSMTDMFKKEVPHKEYRTITIGLLLSAFVFISLGIMFRCFKVEFDSDEKETYNVTKILKMGNL